MSTFKSSKFFCGTTSDIKLKTMQSLLKTTSSLIQFPQLCTVANEIKNMKISVIGAAGRIGKALALMLKQSPLIDELCIHDELNTKGIAEELNYVDTNCKVKGYSGKKEIGEALVNSKIVVVLASSPECLDVNVDSFVPNSKIIKDVMNDISQHSPKAFIGIVTNPLNSMVPLACEVLKKNNVYNPNTVFGITALDNVRANTFAARVVGVAPECILVPVIGGHTEDTIIPVLSQTKPATKFSSNELESITNNVRNAHCHMKQMTLGASAPLCSAFACTRFVLSLVKAIKGYDGIVECAYVPSEAHTCVSYLATPLLLGHQGIAKNFGVPILTDYEQCMLDNAIQYLKDDIKAAERCIKF